MQEIWIPEFFITLFLFLPLVRPFFKKTSSIDGLSWLPLAGLLTALALIPAYGFRPEAFPLLIYAAILTVVSISRLVRGRAKFESSRETKIIFALCALVLLAGAAGIAFFFTPVKDTALSTPGFSTPGVSTLRVASVQAAGKAGEREYIIRVYTDVNDSRPSRRPLLVLLPPLLGSQAAVDQVSGELRDRGFTVLSYSRRDHASWRGVRALSSGTASAKANAQGRVLEEAGKEELLFLLSWIAGNPRVEGTPLFDIASSDAVFLAGYDAGGSALILLGNSLTMTRTAGSSLPNRAFSPGGLNIRGLIVIETQLWSVYREKALKISDPPPGTGGFRGWFQSIRYSLNRWYLEMQPKKLAGLGQIPELSAPVLFLVSDKCRENKYRDGRYLALFRSFNAARGPAVLASADGAGPLDYSDFPVTYPLITALFPGRLKPARSNLEAPAVTAGIISYFAARVLEAQEGEPSPLGKASLPAGVLVESRNYSWQ